MIYKSFFITIYVLASLNAYSGKSKSLSSKKTKSEYRVSVFNFVSGLLTWAAYAKKKQNENEDLRDIYYKIPRNKIEQFGEFLEKNREALYALYKYNDLHIINGQKIIPDSIYELISYNFSLTKLKDPIDRNVALIKMIGGKFTFNKNKEINVKGLIEKIESFDISSWEPIKFFINNFKDTLTLNASLAAKLGRTILPLVENYFEYLDTVNRIRLFKGVCDSWNEIHFNGSKYHDLNQLGIKIFQNTGPILIKLLQELQEEVVGDTPITSVLLELKNSTAMPAKKIKEATKVELLKLLKVKKIKDFKMRAVPLGIASIAQTHLFQLKNKMYVVKVQKKSVADTFKRESQSIGKMVKIMDVFDKGMKQRIQNTNEGITEELNFNYERRNIELGRKVYTDREENIQTIVLPEELNDSSKNGSKSILIMNLAEGESVGKIIEKKDPDLLIKTYEAVKRLYKKFLIAALDHKLEKNFYHGDLHRENIFYNFKNDKITLIDFGNGGRLSSTIKDHVLNLYHLTQETCKEKDENYIEEAIKKLGSSLESFLLKINRFKKNKSVLNEYLTKVFFRTCFNPNAMMEERLYENKNLMLRLSQLSERKDSLLNSSRVNNNLSVSELQEIENIQDDIDFIKALTNNCLNGPTNPILGTLASKDDISSKLQLVFQELQKNGIAMPKEIIFFNKSNGLLQGILNNLMELLGPSGESYYIDPDDIFENVIRSIN